MKYGMDMGGSIVSRNVWERKGRIKWCFREESVHEHDNGWRFLSEIDTDEFLHDNSNLLICAWGTVFEIEPAIMPIFDMPVGTELTLVYEGEKKFFIYSETGEPVWFE